MGRAGAARRAEARERSHAEASEEDSSRREKGTAAPGKRAREEADQLGNGEPRAGGPGERERSRDEHLGRGGVALGRAPPSGEPRRKQKRTRRRRCAQQKNERVGEGDREGK